MFSLGLIIIIVLIILLILYLFNNTQNGIQNNNVLINNTDILQYYKTGGIMGMMYHIDFYNNGTYSVFDHDKIIFEDNLNEREKHAVLFFRNNLYQMPNNFCKPPAIVNDGLNISMKMNGRSVLFNEEDNCPLPAVIKQNLKVIDNLIPDKN